MKRGVVWILAPTVLFACLAGAVGLLVDLSGWWRVLEDNGHFINIQQQGADVTIRDGDGTFIANGVFADDTLLVFLNDPEPDTIIFVYAADTLRGHNEEGDPLTFVRYAVDLNGLWKILEGNEFIIFQQQGTDVTIWQVDLTDWHIDSTHIADGIFANDTLWIFMAPPMEDTLVLIYAADTLRGLDPEGYAITIVRAPQGPWSHIRCGTITVDGVAEDWPDEFLAADDPVDDGTMSASADLSCLYLCQDSAYLYIRIDCVGDAAFPHSGGYDDRYSVFLSRYINQQSDYLIRIWNQFSANFRNNVTAEETALDAPGVMGRTIEVRVPRYLLEEMENAEVVAESEYYDWDFGWDAYDEIRVPAKSSPCVCGDADGNMTIHIGDAVWLVSYIFREGPPPKPHDAGDADCDGIVNIGDVVFLINYIFKSGPQPCCP